jgi:hypothetical protein
MAADAVRGAVVVDAAESPRAGTAVGAAAAGAAAAGVGATAPEVGVDGGA